MQHRVGFTDQKTKAVLADQWIYIDGGEVSYEKGKNIPSMLQTPLPHPYRAKVETYSK